MFTAMHEGFTEINAKINALVDAQIRSEENLTRLEANVARTEANVARTDENLARTDENLNKLTSDVDRYLRNKNGT